MTTVTEKLLTGTSKAQTAQIPALLMLEDGTAFWGTGCGVEGAQFGEICFNTSLVGYLEIITDPSYAGQIVVMSYPQIGNYGVRAEDTQAKHPVLRALVVHDLCETPSNWRSEESLSAFLAREGVLAMQGIDTRSLIRHIRDNGAMKAGVFVGVQALAALLDAPAAASALSLDEQQRFEIEAAACALVQESPRLTDTNFVARVSRTQTETHSLYAPFSFALQKPHDARFRVVAYDCGVKTSILDNLVRCGCALTVVPWNTPAEEVLAMAPDGVFLSNGPGDPDLVEGTYSQVEKLLGKVPVFGICLGHQMICKASGATIEKLAFGHHGGNQPVMNMLTRRVEVTAQNHGFSVVWGSLGRVLNEKERAALPAEYSGCEVRMNKRYGRVALTHVNLNDSTPEGLAFLDIPAFCVQYHPEASPGPSDSHYLFTAFARLMEGRSDYLDIDIAQDRLAGWKFVADECAEKENAHA